MAATIDEALETLHRTGPELVGGSSSHGPVAAEALCTLGRSDADRSPRNQRLVASEKLVSRKLRQIWRSCVTPTGQQSCLRHGGSQTVAAAVCGQRLEPPGDRLPLARRGLSTEALGPDVAAPDAVDVAAGRVLSADPLSKAYSL